MDLQVIQLQEKNQLNQFKMLIFMVGQQWNRFIIYLQNKHIQIKHQQSKIEMKLLVYICLDIMKIRQHTILVTNRSSSCSYDSIDLTSYQFALDCKCLHFAFWIDDNTSVIQILLFTQAAEQIFYKQGKDFLYLTIFQPFFIYLVFLSSLIIILVHKGDYQSSKKYSRINKIFFYLRKASMTPNQHKCLYNYIAKL